MSDFESASLNSPDPGSELALLIGSLCDGTLSQEDCDRLESLLRGNVAARSFYLDYVRVHAALHLRSRSGPLMSSVFTSLPQGAEYAAGISNAPLEGGVVQPQPPQHPAAPTTWESPPSQPSPFAPSDTAWSAEGPSASSGILGDLFRVNFSFPLVSLLALLVAAAFLFGVVTSPWLGRRAASPPAGATSGTASVTPVAYLTLANGCDWGKRSAQVQVGNGAVNSGDELTLLEGIADFRLSSGVSLSVEGPTTLVMASPSSLGLQQGKLTALVPWKAATFQILAGANRLTAVDAEFGVQLKGNCVSIHVFSGEVSVALSPYLAIEGTTVSPENLASDEIVAAMPITIKQSEAVELVSNSDGKTTVRRFAADQNQFASKMTMAGELPITSRYVEAVRRSKPLGYWRFEAVENQQIRNEIPTGCPLRVTTELRLPGDRKNRVLESGYAYDKDNLVSTETMDTISKGNFSFELWIKPSHYHRGILVALDKEHYPADALDKAPMDSLKAQEPRYHFQLETLSDFGFKPGTLHCFIDTSLGDRSSQLHCFSDRSLYKLRRWQHVAIVKENATLMLYVDAKSVSTSKGKSNPPLAEGQYLFVGSPQSFHGEAQFIGQLDELSIYDRALSPEEIKEHFEAVNGRAIEAKRPSESREAKPATLFAPKRKGGVGYVNDS